MQMVGAEAGVSVATVSRALRGHPSVSSETCERVRRTAREMGYRPNPLVSALIAGRRHPRAADGATVLAYVTSTPVAEDAKQAVNYWEIYRGARDRATELGFRLEEFCLRAPGMSGARVSQILRTRGICGAVIAPVPESAKPLDMEFDRFAIAAVGLSLRRPRLHRASPDYYQAMRVALRELSARGYKRVGLAVRDEVDRRFDRQWTARYLAHQQDLPIKKRLPVCSLELASDIPQRFLQWVKKNRPDVVISSDIRELTTLKKAGYGVPGDIGYIHLGVVPRYGDVAGINQNAALVGAGAVDLASAQMYRSEFGIPAKPKIALVESEWKDGGTVGSPEEPPKPEASAPRGKEKEPAAKRM